MLTWLKKVALPFVGAAIWFVVPGATIAILVAVGGGYLTLWLLFGEEFWMVKRCEEWFKAKRVQAKIWIGIGLGWLKRLSALRPLLGTGRSK